MAADYEKLGAFYLGREYDLAAGARRPGRVLYDSKDLVTHAVCVGMTGSGKTGLGIGLIEEAAIDGVPVLAIDPKGDLANLLLTFPNLAPADFAPWVDPAEAGRHNLSPDAFAAQQAERWKAGLAEWDQDGGRIARLRAAADFRLYTPGSRAGVPLALLNSLRAPANENDDDARTRVTTTASSLLALAGLTDVAPHSREQALVAAILSAPAAPADLPGLVGAIQKPPFDRIGVLDLETFYPAKDRQELALRFNSVLATPGFDVWLDGDPLDAGSMLYTPEGKPRVAIVSIAHLGDAERMLVVSLLLSALLDWTRRQGGTSSLRAMLYMDEVFGYLPPVANPPSKAPLLTLLKQARAFGVGIVLSTQNPVDLDYKGLSNTGTWFLGKLQTERDKARMLDGLEGVTAGLDRKALDATLSSLKSRVFLMHNVHESGPVVFETRWTLSYLRGPMGREELKRASGTGATAAKPSAATTNGGGPGTADQGRTKDEGRTKDPAPSTKDRPLSKPVLPAAVPEYFLGGARGARFHGVLYGAARVHYTDAKLGIDTTQDLHVAAAFTEGPVPVDWDTAEPVDERPEDLAAAAADAGAAYAPLPAAALDARKYTAWTKDFGQWVMRAERLMLYSAPAARLTSQAGESERDFRLRVAQAARESRDAEVQKLRDRFAPKIARLTSRIETVEAGVSREQDQASQQRTQTMVSFGATVLGALMGRKAVSAATLGRATTAVRGVGRSMKESQDVARAQEKLSEAQEELKALEAEINEEIAALTAVDPGTAAIETIEVKPKRGGVDVRLVALAWKPIE